LADRGHAATGQRPQSLQLALGNALHASLATTELGKSLGLETFLLNLCELFLFDRFPLGRLGGGDASLVGLILLRSFGERRR
jgi:hypothetical protein